ncbi:MAG: OsmC family protein, partial [Planctomycetota bacterium]
MAVKKHVKTLTVSFPGGKRVDVEMDGKTVPTDQPKKDGGEDSAPAPFQLFLISIAACAGVYAQEFCHARKISTEGMKSTMQCDYDTDLKRFSKMTIELTLPEGFP